MKILIINEAKLVNRSAPSYLGSEIQSSTPKQNKVSQKRSAFSPFVSRSLLTPKPFSIFGIVVLKRTQ